MTKFLHSFPKLLFGVSVLLFLACLTQDSYHFKKGDAMESTPALFLLFMGWYGLVAGYVAWFANPVMSLAWFLFVAKKPGFAAAGAALALALMLSFLFQDSVIASEAPTYAVIAGYAPGFWLWVASAASLLVASIFAAMPTEFLDAEQKA